MRLVGGVGGTYQLNILTNPCTRDIWILDQISLDFLHFPWIVGANKCDNCSIIYCV